MIKRFFSYVVERIRKNWKAKLGSLLLAILFYFYVQYTESISKTFYLKVEPPALPSDLVFSEEVPSFVKVTFTGPQELMDFDKNSFKLVMQNPGPVIGKNRFRFFITPSPPENLQVQIDPQEIEVTLDIRKRKFVPLVPVVEVPSSKRILYWNIQPAVIAIEGPGKIINEMDRIYLKKIQLSPTENIYYDKIMIDSLPKFVKIAENQPYEIQLEIRYATEEELQEKKKTLTAGYTVTDEELKVQCSNYIEKIELVGEPKVKIVYVSKSPLPPDSLKVEVFCPVEWNAATGSIEPNPIISGIPVFVRSNITVQEFEILMMEPLVIDLNFKMKKTPAFNQLERGLQEHLIR